MKKEDTGRSWSLYLLEQELGTAGERVHNEENKAHILSPNFPNSSLLASFISDLCPAGRSLFRFPDGMPLQCPLIPTNRYFIIGF